MSFEWVSDPAIWASLATLTLMEIVLGIDNIVFISVIVGRLPAEQSKRARQIGLALALVFHCASKLADRLKAIKDRAGVAPAPLFGSRILAVEPNTRH